MISFLASEPFPQVDLSLHSIAELQNHAARVDHWLGFRTEEIEKRLGVVGSHFKVSSSSGEKQQLWFGLAVQILQTPYIEIRTILEKLQVSAGQTVVDLGAAYGRMGIVMGRHFSRANFVGYEYVGERVSEGQRIFSNLKIASARIEHCDLAAATFQPIPADIFFIYDFGTPKAIEKALHDLRRISQQRPIRVVARGRHCRYLIANRHSWLCKVNQFEPETSMTIYRSSEEAIVQPRDKHFGAEMLS